MTIPSTLHDDAWLAWHPRELAARLAGTARPWCVVGGWALDLWHGRQTRPHEDLEFTVLRGDLARFRSALPGLRFHAVGGGRVTFLPANEEPGPDIAQVWCEDVAAGCWRADMMLEDGTEETWVYKRDPSIRRPRREVVRRTEDDIFYLAPAAVLLFKAKYGRAKDEADFRRAVPRLDREERTWLRACILKAHPGHDWVAML
jgi:hypothetical protein